MRRSDDIIINNLDIFILVLPQDSASFDSPHTVHNHLDHETQHSLGWEFQILWETPGKSTKQTISYLENLALASGKHISAAHTQQ